MRRPAQTILLLLGGLGLLRISLLGDLYLRYVKEGLRPLLIASGVLLLLLGAMDAVAYRRGRQEGHEPSGSPEHLGHDGHDHSTLPRAAWLLFFPVLSLLFYAPPALGAYTASREAPEAVTEQRHFDPLPATSPVPMTLTEFTGRVQQDRRGSVEGRSVRLTGFVTPDERDGWYLTRIVLSCCAADARTVKVRIHGAPALPADTWVAVTGTWHPGGTLGTRSAPAALDARTVDRIDRPVNAYKDDLPLATTR
ncbi:MULTISPECIES: TIGR03943 family putative permease subunit [Streptomyces]|uniref:Membrane protein n=1 Tax=Streptomyces nodosus TaxID=40318 RepID=A0A0B5DMH0_9ACTN|nr:TIGR03943 family protein [Streptomyces nodosus]AJE41636.1 membrane protein [Streptomyces nodosus]MBB4792844.1 putative repeat protein (TIGR03943 family) [Streptomyces nodosus]MYV48691.1 TIGR03943 family protein [Streptomyces sp. SID2888]QEV40170.1 TIGR03943 family protein [Streptomyces nodosus]